VIVKKKMKKSHSAQKSPALARGAEKVTGASPSLDFWIVGRVS
jgi:hypothetical protein